jgi:hypothetical protein
MARVAREQEWRHSRPNRADEEPSMIAPGLYRHYKNKLYRVVGMATHSETEEALVLYHRDGETRLWARPASMWSETVETPDGPRPRFDRVGD